MYANRAIVPSVEVLLFKPSHNLEKIQIKQGYKIKPARVALKLDCSSLMENADNLL
jgi:hypothetical protein